MILSAQQIREAKRRAKTQTISVPEWGGDVRIGLMSLGDKDSWDMETYTGRSGGSNAMYRAGLVARCMVDEAGKRLFTNEDAKWIAELDDCSVSPIFDAAYALNGLGKKGVEDAEKNSVAGPTGNSSSSSPAPTASSPATLPSSSTPTTGSN